MIYKMDSGHVLEALHKDIKSKYPTRLNVSEFTTPNGNRRMDMLSIDYMSHHVRGYEIKVSRQDFLQDKKWTDYLAFCNQFYFICPEGLIAANELPPEIGLIYAEMGHIYEHYDNKEPIRTSQRCIRMNLIRGSKQSNEVSDIKHDYIYRRLLFRTLDLHQLIKPAPFYQEGLEYQLSKGLLDIKGNRVA